MPRPPLIDPYAASYSPGRPAVDPDVIGVNFVRSQHSVIPPKMANPWTSPSPMRYESPYASRARSGPVEPSSWSRPPEWDDDPLSPGSQEPRHRHYSHYDQSGLSDPYFRRHTITGEFPGYSTSTSVYSHRSQERVPPADHSFNEMAVGRSSVCYGYQGAHRVYYEYGKVDTWPDPQNGEASQFPNISRHGKSGPYDNRPGQRNKFRSRERDQQTAVSPKVRRPGGPFPEAWEFFQAFHRPLWFVALEGHSSPSNTGSNSYRVLGLCPIKCPLDQCFDRQRDQLRTQYDMTIDAEAVAGEAKMSPVERARLEFERSTKRRFLEDWHPNQIAEKLGEAWAAAAAAIDAMTGTDKPYYKIADDSRPINENNIQAPTAAFADRPADAFEDAVSSETAASVSPASPVAANIISVINLCFTQRYYDSAEFGEKVPVEFIQMEGGTVPSLGTTLRICDLWQELWKRESILIEAKSETELRYMLSKLAARIPTAVIHCTHGVNRTGIVCAILAQMHTNGKLSIAESLKKFSIARNHAQNKEVMTEKLEEIFTPFPPEGLADHPVRQTEASTFVFCDDC